MKDSAMPEDSPEPATIFEPLQRRQAAALAIALVAVIFGGLGAVLLAHKPYQNPNYPSRIVQAAGFRYRVNYSKAASQATTGNDTYLKGMDQSGQTMYLAVAKSTASTSDCQASTENSVTVISRPTIEGVRHNLCYSKTLNLYDSNFTNGKDWYFITMFGADSQRPLDQSTVKMVVASLKIL